MAVEIDTVYQRVLALANKEQRGYITPQEFNLYANQAQLEIFEQYFYDLDQALKSNGEASASLSNVVELVNNKLTPFTSIHEVVYGTTYKTTHPVSLLPVHRTGTIYAGGYTAVKVKENEANDLIGSTFHKKALDKNPIYRDSLLNHEDISVFNSTGQLSTGVTCEYIVKPAKTEWGYTVVGGKALYNATRSADSILHSSEESEFVNKILFLAGISMKQPEMVQAAAGLIQSQLSEQKPSSGGRQ
tara:strand:+ start:222 stop:956 length:735 start_codon:yes stop_codon:yes gene_type:complete